VAILSKRRHKQVSETIPYRAIAEKLAADLRFKKLLSLRYKVDRTYDIPYLAGYSEDGKTIYLDRRFKSVMPDGTDITKFIVMHERAEKAALMTLKLKYQDAHRIATYLEHKAVEAAGISWKAYSDFLYPYIRKTDRLTVRRVPKDLDLQPYRDEHDVKHIAAMKKVMKGPVAPEQKVHENKNIIDPIEPIGSTDKYVATDMP
jgi:hypothetical protein